MALGRSWEYIGKKTIRRLLALCALQPTLFKSVWLYLYVVNWEQSVCVSVLGVSSKYFGPLSVPLQKAASTTGASITIMMAASVAVTLPSTNRAKVRSDVLTTAREALLKFLI